MTATTTRVSVVIPTHNRLPCLRQCLDALAQQDYPPNILEVIVVADGCSDDTVAAMTSAQWPFAFRLLTQPASGAAAARNRGAHEASGELLVFLDDDVVASAGLIQAHVRVHEETGTCAAVGPYLPDRPAPGQFLQESLASFWQNTFAALSDPAHPTHYRDLLSGNMSVPSVVFSRLGGFDPLFPACGTEDYEFGIRLLGAGIPIVFAGRAHARHLETTDLDRSMRRNRHGGRSEVLLARLHPSVTRELRLARRDAFAQWLVYSAPVAGVAFHGVAKLALSAASGIRSRWLWTRVYGRLRRYWYWRGVADALPDPGALREFLEEPRDTDIAKTNG